jgi:predicted transcriptional regulator
MAIPRTMTRLESARRTLGLSQIDLAKDVRMAQFFISMIERGTGVPNRDQIERIARRLSLHPDDLLKPVDAVEPEQVHGASA